MGVKKPLKSKRKSVDVFVELGKIIKPVGLKGELKIFPLTRTPQDLDKYSCLILRPESGELTELKVEHLRVQKQFAIIKFKSIDCIDRAEEYIGHEIGIYEDRLPETNQGEYYIRDLIGMEVFSEEGKRLGVLNDVLELSANDIYQVVNADKELLIPALEGVVKQIDLDKMTMTVRLLEGLTDL